MANAHYLTHDLHARNHPSLQKVMRKHGMAGIGLFWCLVEMLHEADGYLKLSDLDEYAFSLRVKTDMLASLLNDFQLFEKDEQRFWSNSALKRIEIKHAKSKRNSEIALEAWSKRKANAMRSHNGSNTNELLENSESNAKIVEDNKIEEKIKKEKIPLPLQAWGNLACPFCEETKSAWLELCAGIKWRKKELPALQRSLKSLMAYPDAFAALLIDKAIAGGYQGVVFDNTPQAFESWRRISPNVSSCTPKPPQRKDYESDYHYDIALDQHYAEQRKIRNNI